MFEIALNNSGRNKNDMTPQSNPYAAFIPLAAVVADVANLTPVNPDFIMHRVVVES